MLTAEQIQQNWIDLEETIKVYIDEPRRSKLLDFYNTYAERIMFMPASSKEAYHNAFDGGYVDHVLRVIDCALKLNDIWAEMGVDTSTYTKEELIFSALNHDLGKMGDSQHEAYIPNTDQWRKDKLGELYTFNKAIPFMSVPDRSLFLLTQHGIEMSLNEYLAIKIHDGMYEEANKQYLAGFMTETKPRTALVYILHQADSMAARIEWEKVWLPKLSNTTAKTETKATKTPIKTKALGTVKSQGLMDMLNDL
jgi:hypothetical protein